MSVVYISPFLLKFVYVCVCVQEDPTLITDIREDIQEECSKFGDVKKILLFDVGTYPVN